MIHIDYEKLNEQEIFELVNQRRRQLLVHSFLYYRMNMNTIEDTRYDEFTVNLIELQDKFPEIAERCIFPDDFRGFQTGWSYQLPYEHPDVQRWALGYLRSREYAMKQDRPKER